MSSSTDRRTLVLLTFHICLFAYNWKKKGGIALVVYDTTCFFLYKKWCEMYILLIYVCIYIIFFYILCPSLKNKIKLSMLQRSESDCALVSVFSCFSSQIFFIINYCATFCRWFTQMRSANSTKILLLALFAVNCWTLLSIMFIWQNLLMEEGIVCLRSIILNSLILEKLT